MREKTHQTSSGTIHYWLNMIKKESITLVFLPGLTADHRLFDKQITYFENKYNYSCQCARKAGERKAGE